LIATTLSVVAVGTYLPFSPLAGVLGFTPLPAKYFAFVAVATGVYLLLVEAAKRLLLRRENHMIATKPKDELAIAT
jgi:Mg2+-importing ATPase